MTARNNQLDDLQKRKKWYSDKKKRHTIKAEILITDKGKICGVSKPYPSKMHDIEVRRRGKPLPIAREILADSGYQGLQKQHKNVRIPIKIEDKPSRKAG